MLTRTTLAALSALALTASAWAQNAPADLVAAYKAGVAAEKCGLQLSSDVSSQLGDAVQRIEQRSGLAQGELDALWTETQAAADTDPTGFCGEAGALVDQVIASAG